MCVATLGGALFAYTAQARPAGQARKTVSEGVYAVEQAARGKAAFETSCAACHGSDLGGGEGPDLVGDRFMDKWDFQSVSQLFREIKTRMPRNNPSTLRDDTYLDIVTYLLEANAFPAGTTELKLDADLLGNILIRKAGGAGRTELPTGALVQLVGCLAQGSDKAWMLTNGGAPVRTENPDPSKGDQRKAVEATPLGARTFRLLNIFGSLDAHNGHKMEAKGFLVRDPGGDRVNVVALEMIGSTCAQ